MANTESGPVANESSWNDRFMAEPFSRIASNEWYGTTTDADVEDRQRVKQEFLHNETLETPNIDYQKLHDERTFDAAERTYQQLLSEATTDSEYTRAARRLAELYRHKEIIRGLGRTGVKYALSQERAGMMAAEIFGRPDRDTHLSLIAKLRVQAGELSNEMPEAAELLELLGDAMPEKMRGSSELEVSTLAILHQDLNELFPGIDEAIVVDGTQEKVPSQVSERCINDLLQFFGLTERGWQVKLIPDSNVAASTDSHTKRITIGERRAEFAPQQLVKTAHHEVLGHAYRAEGQVNMTSLEFEEGFAVALEQIMTGEVRQGSGEQYYTALGLQYGFDQNDVQRNFRDTFEVMWRRAMVTAHASGKPMTREKAREQAYTQVYRTRRGDAIDTRDLAYFEGARIVPDWLNAVAELPQEERLQTLRWVLSGRFDPTNEQHVAQYPLS